MELLSGRFSVINKGLFNLIKNIFWNMGFKNKTQADKVIVIIYIILIISIISILHIIPIIYIIRIILIISLILQVCVDLRIPGHVWQEKRLVIAATIDGLGDKFKPDLYAAWLATRNIS